MFVFQSSKLMLPFVEHPVYKLGTALHSSSAQVKLTWVVIELDPEIVELRSSDNLVHVGLRDGALGGTGDVVGVGGVRLEVGAQSRDQVLVVLVAAVTLDVEVPPVHEGLAEGTRNAAGAGSVTIGIPQVLSNGLGFLSRTERISAGGTAERQDDLDTVALAGRDGLSKVIAASWLACGRDGARLADGTRRNRDAVAVLVKESEDNDVDSSLLGAVGGKIVVLNSASAVLSPVYDIFGVRRRAGSLVRSSRSESGRKAEASKSREMHFM